jgi:serine/threonine protein kinase/Tol biopolymer transport system component
VIGTSLGHYDVEALLGEGGMGRVFRARDTRLGRAVAIKVLPDAFRADADRAARFEREAKLLAALNHPHIAALYGFENIDGHRFLVMELVEGDTLADRLSRGPLRLEDAIRVALQIAEALEAAHEKGIIHRDLKPANVKLTTDDKIKVLDFGLAKALEPEAASTGLTNSPTLSLAATHAGVVLGTAAYMSPEQAKGLPADHRSDIFSFGVVLHEMLTGRQPFQGETAAEVMASVIVRETDLSALPADVNPRIAELLKRCLEKNPRKRWQAIGDVRAELEAIASAPFVKQCPTDVRVDDQRPWWRRALTYSLAAAAGAAVAALVIYSAMPSPPPAGVTRFTLPLPEGQAFTNPGRRMVTISPDGSKMVYVANSGLWLRSMAESEARPIAGTGPVPQGVTHPVFSPDGQAIAFYALAERALKVVPVAGGTPVPLATIANPFGMHWDRTGLIVGQGDAGIVRVPATGGTPETILRPPAGEVIDSPQLLDGGEWLLFTVSQDTGADRWAKAQVVVQSLASGERRILVENAADGRYLPTGHLVYGVNGTLFAIRFDPTHMRTIGGPVGVLEGVAQSSGNNTSAAHWSVSDRGTLMYLPGTVLTAAPAMLAWLDGNGSIARLPLPARAYRYPRLSHDGRRLVVAIIDDDEQLWTYDLSGAAPPQRLTFGGNNTWPVWTSDDQYVAFHSDRDDNSGIFRQRADTPGAAERLTRAAAGQLHVPHVWSPDGSTLLFSIGENGRFTLCAYTVADGKTTRFEEIAGSTPLGAVLSRDGRWLAYDEDGTVFVRPFPPNGTRYQIRSGVNPLWSPDGRALLIATGSGMRAMPIEAVRINTTGGFRIVGTSVQIPRPPEVVGAAVRNFDGAADGRLLVVVASPERRSGSFPTSISVVLNWFEELRARVPAR